MLAGEDLPPIYGTDEAPDGEFHVTEADTWDGARTTWLAEIEAARTNAAKVELDGLSVGTSKRGTPLQPPLDVHAHDRGVRPALGHADLVRERIDGATGA